MFISVWDDGKKIAMRARRHAGQPDLFMVRAMDLVVDNQSVDDEPLVVASIIHHMLVTHGSNAAEAA